VGFMVYRSPEVNNCSYREGLWMQVRKLDKTEFYREKLEKNWAIDEIHIAWEIVKNRRRNIIKCQN